jgi:hypothetical protein
VRALVARDVMNRTVPIVASEFGPAVGVVGAAAVAYERLKRPETIGVDG